ncbi:MAG: protein kinase [Gemmatimonadetes bacterium]|nr:protein kinase [Gemmatimonadota bacterium]
MPPSSAFCSSCGAARVASDAFCAQCGAEFSRRCARCGSSLLSGDRWCPDCGDPQSATAVEVLRTGEVATHWDTVLRRLRVGLKGEYHVTRRLGVGGQAAVYLAEEVALQRQVAIKVLAPGSLASSQAIERFQREARTIATLQHSSIVTIYTVRQLEELHFFIMRYLVGRPLSAVIDAQGALPVDAVRAIAYSVGSALHFAHRRNVVHRDVKPANVLFDEDGNAIVTDFGIAKDLAGTSSTATSVVMGTPAYLSPEQCYQRPVSGASDQYAMGVVVYEMLTARVPFEGPTLEVMQGHTSLAPPPIRPTRPDCPRDLEAAVMRMMAKRPEQRFPTMLDALDALGAVPLPEASRLRDQIIDWTTWSDGARGTALTPTDPRRTPSGARGGPAVAPTPDAAATQSVDPEPPVSRRSAEHVVPAAQADAEKQPEPAGATAEVVPERVPSDASSSSSVDTRTHAPARTASRGSRTLALGVGGLVVVAAIAYPALSRRGAPQSDGAPVAADAPATIAALATDSIDPDSGTAVEPTRDSAATALAATPLADTARRATIAGVPSLVLPGDTVPALRVVLRRAGERVSLEAGERVEWTSRDPSVAMIDRESGRVTAATPGETRIEVRVGESRADTRFRVETPQPSAVEVLGASSTRVQESISLRAVVRDQRGRPIPGSLVRWGVGAGEQAVATIDQSGLLRAVGAGRVNVTVVAGDVNAQHTVTVAARATEAAVVQAPAVKEAIVAPPPAKEEDDPDPVPAPRAASAPLLTEVEVRGFAEGIGSWITGGAVGELQRTYRVEEPADGGKRDRFLNFVRTTPALKMRSARLATTPEDAGRGRVRAALEVDWATPFARKSIVVQIFLLTKLEGRRYLLDGFRVANDPKY